MDPWYIVRANGEKDNARAQRIAEERRKIDDEKIERLRQDVEAAKRLREDGIKLPSGVDELTPQEHDHLLKEKQKKPLQQALEQEKKMQTRQKYLNGWIRATREAEKDALSKERWLAGWRRTDRTLSSRLLGRFRPPKRDTVRVSCLRNRSSALCPSARP